MKVVANLDFEINTYIPRIRIKTSPTDFYPIEQVQMMRFSGENWQLFGPIIDGHGVGTHCREMLSVIATSAATKQFIFAPAAPWIASLRSQ